MILFFTTWWRKRKNCCLLQRFLQWGSEVWSPWGPEWVSRCPEYWEQLSRGPSKGNKWLIITVTCVAGSRRCDSDPDPTLNSGSGSRIFTHFKQVVFGASTKFRLRLTCSLFCDHKNMGWKKFFTNHLRKFRSPFFRVCRSRPLFDIPVQQKEKKFKQEGASSTVISCVLSLRGLCVWGGGG